MVIGMHRSVLTNTLKLMAMVASIGLVTWSLYGCGVVNKTAVKPAIEKKCDGFMPGFFIETKSLEKVGKDPDVVLIDARPVENYRSAHIPGAVNIPKTTWREAEDIEYKRDHGFAVSPAKASKVFGGAGISENTRVIVYDSVTFPDASVVQSLLKYFGHKDVTVLNGGYEKWVAEGRPVDTDTPPVQSSLFVPRPHPEKVATTDWLLKHRSDVVLLDMRSFEEYVGADAAGNPRGGSVPGAINIEWLELAGKSTVKPAEEVERILRRHGVTKNKEFVTYCNWGIGRSTYGAMVLESLGYKNVRIFGGSMEDWSARQNLPIADSQSLGSGL